MNKINDKGKYPVMEIAHFIIDYCSSKSLSEAVSNFTLQRLLFCLWMEYYIHKQDILFAEQFDVSPVGPIITVVRYEYCAYGSMHIDEDYETNLALADELFLQNCIDKYQKMDPIDLANLTRSDNGAWEYVRCKKGLGFNIPFSEIIKRDIRNISGG